MKTTLTTLKRLLAALLLLAAVSTGAAAAGRSRGDYLTLKAAVMGPGDELYFWWGHFGLVIEDALSGSSRFYDYGVFSFDNENFFLNFAFGRLIYTSTVSDTAAVLRRYVADNRDITLYTLDLDAAQKEAIFRAAERNLLPENRDYLYNHFTDNCVTRVTNLLDDALGGRFYAAAEAAPGRMTLRSHVRRHTYFSPFWDWFLSFIMGRGIDGPSTVRQEMFLPSEAGRFAAAFRYTDADGSVRPLTSAVEVLNTATGRPPVLDAPPRSLHEAFFGIGLALLLCLFMLVSRKRPVAGRVLLGLTESALGLFFGTAGSVLFFMTFFTNHDYSWHNINVVFVNPLLLAAVPLGINFAFAKTEARRALCGKLLWLLWAYVLASGLLAVLLNLRTGSPQVNGATLALVLPVAVAGAAMPIAGRK
jgi:hypothetical protein